MAQQETQYAGYLSLPIPNKIKGLQNFLQEKDFNG